jgi:hypothetical protein
VRPIAGCDGDGRPHHPADEDCRVNVTAVDRTEDGELTVFALYKGGGAQGTPPPDGGLGLGPYSRPDELEPIPEPP